LQFDGTVTLTCALTYGQGWLALYQSLMGTESTPAEQTASQADYLVNHDLANSIYGIFWTLGFSIESDRTISIPSVKWTSMSLSIAPNQAGTVTFQGIADRYTEGSANTVTEIQALTQYTYNEATLGGANHYFRQNADSGGSLSSSDDKTITNLNWTITRDHDKIFGLRAANSQFTMEPQQLGPIKQVLTVTMSELDNASWDMWGQWLAQTTLKAEFFLDGNIIGSTLKESLKFQWPYLWPTAQVPGGHDFSNNNSRFTPTLSWESLKRSAAPTGMSGVTAHRLAEIHRTRSTKWSA